MPDVLTVEEASATYASAMRNMAPAGPGVCEVCWTFIDPVWQTCYRCGHQPNLLGAAVPITYSEHLGQMHLALRNYKDGVVQTQNFAMPRLAAILWRFLAAHEPCLAAAARVSGFDVVTTVPSSTRERDEKRMNLRTIVGWCEPVKDRLQRVLRPSAEAVQARYYDQTRYEATERLDGKDVLLIDDTWTTGGHAQSAAYALRSAGADTVALVVIGRHVQPDYEIREDDTAGDRLEALPKVFDWSTCPVH